MTSELKSLVKEAQKRTASYRVQYMPALKRAKKGFAITCKECKAKNKIRAYMSNEPEHYGASETIPSEVGLNFICTNCGNTAEVWSDWRPTEIAKDLFRTGREKEEEL